MSRGGVHTPRKTYEKVCEECGIKYIAFRSTSRFHSDGCRSQHYNHNDLTPERSQAIDQSGGRCAQCGGEVKRPYWRVIKALGPSKQIVCGICHSLESRLKFWERVPEPDRHLYVREFRKRKRAADSLEKGHDSL
jgi:hypothetical protein